MSSRGYQVEGTASAKVKMCLASLNTKAERVKGGRLMRSVRRNKTLNHVVGLFGGGPGFVPLESSFRNFCVVANCRSESSEKSISTISLVITLS